MISSLKDNSPRQMECHPWRSSRKNFPIFSPNEELAGGEASKQARTDFTVQTWLGFLMLTKTRLWNTPSVEPALIRPDQSLPASRKMHGEGITPHSKSQPIAYRVEGGQVKTAKTKEENKVKMISAALAVNGIKQVRRGLIFAVVLVRPPRLGFWARQPSPAPGPP